MWRNIVQRGGPRTAIWRIRIACWIPKATNTHSVYAILMAFPLHQWLHKSASTFRYTIHCLSRCCLHGQKYSHITQGLYCVQWRRIVSVGGIVTGRGIVVRFRVGKRCFDVLNNVQTHFRAHPLSCLTLRRLMSYIYMEHPFLMFLDHTQRRNTVGRTPLDE